MHVDIFIIRGDQGINKQLQPIPILLKSIRFEIVMLISGISPIFRVTGE
jgi:hypothetical protein